MIVTGLENLSKAADSIFEIMIEVLPEMGMGNPEMGRDIFSSFYQTEPPVVKAKGADWSEDLGLLIHMGIFPKMRRITRRDATMAAMATLSAIDAITAWHLMDESIPQTTGGIPGDSQTIMYQDLMEIEEIRDKMPDVSEDEDSGSGGEAGEDADNPGSDVGSGGDGFSNKGLDLPSITSDPAIRIQMLAELKDNPNLSNLFKIFGQLKEVASELYKDNIFTSRGSSTYDIGGDISRVPVSEIVKPIDLLGRDLAHDEALQHSNDDDGLMGEGPLAVILDQSGSMGIPIDRSSAGTETRLDFAVSMALVLQQICADQGRHIMIQMFSHANQASVDCPDGKISPKDINTIIRTLSCGGTEFRKPVKRAIEWIGEHSYEDKADIVMITDGCAGENWGDYSTDWAAYYKELPKHECSGTHCELCVGEIEKGQAVGEMITYWQDKKADLERMGVRFWGLQMGGRMDRGIAYIADRIFVGLDSMDEREEAYKSVLREMIEIRKPTWLR